MEMISSFCSLNIATYSRVLIWILNNLSDRTLRISIVSYISLFSVDLCNVVEFRNSRLKENRNTRNCFSCTSAAFLFNEQKYCCPSSVNYVLDLLG